MGQCIWAPRGRLLVLTFKIISRAATDREEYKIHLIEQKDQRLSLKQSTERKKRERKKELSQSLVAVSFSLFGHQTRSPRRNKEPSFSLFDCVAISNKDAAAPPPSVVGLHRRFSYSTRNLIVKKRSKHNRGKRVDQDIVVRMRPLRICRRTRR